MGHMAIDNLSGEQFGHLPIFHGTNAVLKAGDVVKPAKQVGFTGYRSDGSSAWASEDAEEARSYGKNVYKVSHLEDPAVTVHTHSHPRTYGSRVGFKIVGPHEQ